MGIQSFYGIQYGVFFDFHPVLFGVALLAWFVYFLKSKRQLFGYFFFHLHFLLRKIWVWLLQVLAVYIFLEENTGNMASGFFIGGVIVSLLASKSCNMVLACRISILA